MRYHDNVEDAMTRKIAALVGELVLTANSSNTQKRIQLLPDGRFRTAADGRPDDVPHWILDSTNGFTVASQANATENDLVIDYEHQTINTTENGRPAPAAGWIKHVEYIPGKGLFADVEWTDNAARMIAAREYRYVSAVFTYDNNGYVLRLLHAAITNFPALDGMAELMAACSQFFTTKDKETDSMEEILKLLRQAFKMPDATEQQLQTALTALVKTQPADVALSAAFTKLAEQNSKIVALSTQVNNPDPAKLVSVETMQELQKQIAVLTAQLNSNKAAQVIENALANGQLLPAQKQWATDLAATPDGLVKLTAYLATMPAIASLSGKSGQQSAANSNPEKVAALTENEKAAAKALGYSEAEYRDLMKEEGK
jgi:phage I-like protein